MFQAVRFALLCLAALWIAALDVSAQRPPVPPINLSYLRIDFVTPGARPAALGGAFIGAAQDETAAAINPAGLTYLKHAGASLHQRQAHRNFEEPEGSPANPDGRNAFQTNTFNQTLVGVIVPIKRVTIALFRHVALDSRYAFETEQFLTTSANLTTRQVLGGPGNFPGRKVDLDLEMIHDGIAFAYQVNRRLSIGVTGKTSALNFRLNERTFLDPVVANGETPRGNLAETTYSITALDEREVEPGFSFGIMGNVIRDKLFLGAVLNLNPTFNMRSDIFLPEYEIDGQTFPAESPADTEIKLSIPESYGVGVYYIAHSRLRFSFDLVRIEYSDLLSENNRNAGADDEFNPQSNAFEDPDGQPDLTVADATEWHFGVEYLVKAPKLGLIPLRFGLFTDPGHRIHAVGGNPDLLRRFPKDEDRLHFAFGLGLVFNSYLKFDASFSASEDGYELFGSTLLSVPL